LAAHHSGNGAKYTRSRRPVEFIQATSGMTKSDALKLEYRVKQVSAVKKISELTKGENKLAMNLQKELQAVNKGIKALTRKVKKIIVATGGLEKPKPKTPKAKWVKMAADKRPAVKKPVKSSGADIVFGVVRGSQKGIDTAVLMKKTGFNAKKIHNIIFRLKKQNKIKSDVKGTYLPA